MNLLLTAEQEMLRAEVRRLMTTGIEPPSAQDGPHGPRREGNPWTKGHRQLGLFGLLLDGEHGGSGAGMREIALVLQESGAVLDPAPLLSASFAAACLARMGGPVAAMLAPDLATGRRQAAFVRASRPDDAIEITPDQPGASSGSARLTAQVRDVLDGLDADFYLVLGRGEGGGVLAVVDAAQAGVSRSAQTSLDLSRQFARIEAADAPAQFKNLTTAEVDDLLARLGLMVSAELTGVIRHCLDTLSAYAKIRRAFGRPIGSFEAVKHQLADMYCAYELADSAVRAAAWAADADGQQAALAAAVAELYTTRSAVQVTTECVRLYGGIGYTWEHEAHRYFRRARVNQVLLGQPEHHAGRVADLLAL